MEELLLGYIKEDLGVGDITTDGVFRGERVRASIRAKEDGVLAGIPFAIKVFEILGGVDVIFAKDEGEKFRKGDDLLVLEGQANIVLKGERLALNILQRLSGISTLTKKVVNKLENTNIKLLDTRKTTPGFRFFEKYAVRVGGGFNHRFALYDMVLIKDNHKRLAGSIKEAVRRVRRSVSPVYKVEVEVENLLEVEEALKCGVDIVMLDNFSPQMVKEAVSLVKGAALIEVSGNINLDNIPNYAIKGVDYISCGFITHSARWIDISLSIEP
ncbi:MAG: carboxylating nicotinate-nucleotide diphosphorylase [Aquificaceae bacterium]